jgi:hypothetical protein
MVKLFRIVVEGEAFDVAEQDGSIQFSWVSGPDPDYGFSISRSDGKSPTEDEARSEIRSFLSLIDPGTGHLAE